MNKGVFLTCIFCSFIYLVNAQSIQLKSTFHSIGYTIYNIEDWSSIVDCKVRFKESTSSRWRNGLKPSLNILNHIKELSGSILQVKSATTYDLDIELSYIDSQQVNKSFKYTGIVQTRVEPTITQASSDTLWVSPAGLGGQYSFNNPGSFERLFKNDAGKISCNTLIMCKGGLYNIGNLSFNISLELSLCDPTNSVIKLMGVPGSKVIFDGSDRSLTEQGVKWIITDSSNSIYSAVLPASVSFSTLFLYEGHRLFPYATVYPRQNSLFCNFLLPSYYRVSLSNAASHFGSGFYRNGNNYSIKLMNNENPNNKEIILSKYSRLLGIYNLQKKSPRFLISNIECRYYGKPTINYIAGTSFIESEYDACALEFYNLTNTIVDNCFFNFNTASLYFSGNSDSTLIQNCQLKDETGLWQHGAFKNTSLTITGDINGICDDGKYGRHLEKAFVFFEPGLNEEIEYVIIRNNIIDGIVSGYAARQSEISPFREIDVYNNEFLNCYDATDILGNVVNYRVWNNKFTNNPIVFSMIPFIESGITYSNVGPVYIFRNIVEKQPTRSNPKNLSDNFNPSIYINYNGCEGQRPKVWSTGLKLETGNQPELLRTDIHLYHNTFVTEDSLSYAMFLWRGTWRNIFSKNNIFYSRYGVVNFQGVENAHQLSYQSISDSYYSENTKLGIINKVHGNNSTCSNYYNLESLEKNLRMVSKNFDTNQLAIRGYVINPQFENLQSSDYQLQEKSECINRGVQIPNLNDLINVNYLGSAPDLGALEFDSKSNLLNETLQVDYFRVLTSIIKDFVEIEILDSRLLNTSFLLADINGIVVNEYFVIKNIQKLDIDQSFASGLYFLFSKSDYKSGVKKILVSK